MKSILVELTCHQCMYHTYRKSETLILSEFETNARKDLLNDDFFTMKCPRCGNLIEFIHPLAYVDTIHKFILLIKSRKDFKVEDHNLYADDCDSRKRFIYKHQDIGEKIRIFEDGMDDRAIEIIKYKIKQVHLQKQREIQAIQYHDKDHATQTIWFEVQIDNIKDMLAITMEAYQRIKSTVPNEDTLQYTCVDEQWVQSNII